MTRLPMPAPYNFVGERARIADHNEKFARARSNSGMRPICPYCYEPSFRGAKPGTWRCGCNRQP